MATSPFRRRLINAARVALALLVTACGVATIDDVVTDSAAITDDRLVGEWYEVGGKDRLLIKRGSAREYAVTLFSDDTGHLRARLGRLGPTPVVDVYEETGDSQSHVAFGIPVHLPFGIDVHADSFALNALLSDSVQAIVARGQTRVPISKLKDFLILHGDPEGMRNALGQLFQQQRAMDEKTWYRRAR